MSDLKLAIKLTTEGGKVVVKDLRQIDDAADKVNHSLTGTGKAGGVAKQGFNNASVGAHALTGSIKTMVAQTAGIIALGFGIDRIASGMYQGIDAFQGYRGQLKTITGDFDSASNELDRLILLSKETPFTLQQSVEGFSKLTHLGLDPSRESMISYGNTAAAMGKDLMQMIEAVADASVNEFERLKEFGIKASQQGNTVRLTFQGVSTTLKKDAASIQQYLIDLGNNKFGDAMGDQMVRLSAKSSNLQTSINQLYDDIGNLGTADGIGSSIDTIASSIDTLAEHLPEVIGLLSTLADIVMVGGIAYLGLKALPLLLGAASAVSKTLAINIFATSLAFKSGVSPVALFTGGVKASAVATMEAVVATGLLKSAVLGLFSAYAGWEIGSYLSEQFVEVRVAGLSFVGAMETGLVNLSYSFSAIAPKAQQVWGELTTWLKNKLGVLYSLVGDGLASIGADEMALSYNNFAESLTGSSDAAKAAEKQLAELEAQRQEEIKAVDNIIVGLISYEYAQSSSTKAINKNTQAKKKNNQQGSSNVIELSNNQKLIASLGTQVQMLGLTAKQKLIYTNLSKLSADATLDEQQAINDLTIALFEQQEAQVQLQEQDDFYQNAIDGVNGYSDAWASAGNVIIDTFGSIGQQMESLFTSQDAYTKAIDINHKKQQVVGADLKQLKVEELKLNYANTQEQLNSYSSIAGAAGNMFSENSKAAKIANGIEQALAVASLAMSVEKILMSGTETAAVVANETIKQTALGTTAIISQGQGDPYTAWVRIAAMVALVAGLGIATKGGSGSAPDSSAQRQETQGTGTVLGDESAKSQSLLNAYDRIEGLELDQYAELQQMNSQLKNLNQNITHLATSLVGSYGKFDSNSYGGELGSKSTTSSFESLIGGGLAKLDPTGILSGIIGGFSKTKKSLVDSGISIVGQTLGDIIESGLVNAQAYYDIKTKKSSFWGLSSKKSYSTEYQDIDENVQREFALLFGNIGDTINSAVDILGVDIAKEQKRVLSTQNAISEALQAQYGNDGFDKRLFHDYFNTLNYTFVEGAERSLDNFKIDLPDLSFKDLSADEIEKELQAVFSQQADLMAQYLVPQIKEYQQAGEGLYDTLIRVAQEQAIFNAQMDAMGHSISNIAGVTKESQLAIAQSLIQLMGGIENFQQASSTYFSEFFSEDEQFSYLETQLSSLFSGLDQTLPGTREEFKTLLDGIDKTTDSGIALYGALLGMVGSLDEYYDALERTANTTGDAAEQEQKLADARTAFVENIQTQLLKLDLSPLELKLYNLQKEFDGYIDEAKSLGVNTALVESLLAKKRKAIIDEALNSINASHEREMDKLTSTHEQAVKSLVSNNNALTSSFTGLNASIANSVLSIRRQGSTWNESSYQTGQIDDFSALVGQGSVDEQLTNIGNLEQAYTAKYNAELANINAARDAAQNAYDNQLAQIESKYQSELDVYNSIRAALDSLKEAANSLLLSDFSTLTNEQKLNESKSQFEAVLAKAQRGDADALGQLSNSGNSYLTEAQGFYASGDSYQAIFDQVHGALSAISNKSVSGPSRRSAPPVPSEISNHNTAVKALQESTVEKLLELKTLTAELQEQADSEFDLAMLSLEQQLVTDTEVLTLQLGSDTQIITSKMDEEITEIQALSGGIAQINTTLNDEAKWKVPPIIIERPAPVLVTKTADNNNDKVIAELKAMNNQLSKQNQALVEQTRAANQKADNLNKGLYKYSRTNERLIDEVIGR